VSDEERRTAAYMKATDWTREHPPGTPVLAWPGVREAEPLVTRTRSSAWVISIDDVVVQVDGRSGGIAITHIDHDTTRQPAVPDVEFEMPPCPICDTSLDSDGDSLTCYPCRASWASNGTSGRWGDPKAARCPATARPLPSARPDLIEQCVLHKDHDLRDDSGSRHRTDDGMTSWDDTSSIAVLDGSGEAL
jgi:hypothetical protein